MTSIKNRTLPRRGEMSKGKNKKTKRKSRDNGPKKGGEMAQKRRSLYERGLRSDWSPAAAAAAKFTGWNKLLLRCRELAARLRRTFLAHATHTTSSPSVRFCCCCCRPLLAQPPAHTLSASRQQIKTARRPRKRPRALQLHHSSTAASSLTRSLAG